MGKITPAAFPHWHQAMVALPARSMLYAPAPIGVGTPLGESLTSYLARLAQAHCVDPGPVLQQVVIPQIQQAHQGPSEAPSWWRHPTRNAQWFLVGSRARLVVEALETLTKRQDLRALTLVEVAACLPSKGLLRPRGAWCPACYADWQARGQALYEPLLWGMQAISWCARHGVPLETQCQACARSRPPLCWRSRPGYCPFCAKPLFGIPVRTQERMAADTPEGVWQQWVTETVGALIAQLPTIRCHPKPDRLQQVVTQAVEGLAGGDRAAFARLFAQSKSTIEYWCRGQRMPELEVLLRLGYQLQLPLWQVLFEEAEVSAV